MFNLTAFVNEENKIVVQKLDDFYNASSVVHNIDEYVDSTKGTVDVALPFKEIDFSYTGLGTFLAKQYEQLNNRKWGSLDYSDDSSFDGPQNQYKVKDGELLKLDLVKLDSNLNLLTGLEIIQKMDLNWSIKK